MVLPVLRTVQTGNSQDGQARTIEGDLTESAKQRGSNDPDDFAGAAKRSRRDAQRVSQAVNASNPIALCRGSRDDSSENGTAFLSLTKKGTGTTIVSRFIYANIMHIVEPVPFFVRTPFACPIFGVWSYHTMGGKKKLQLRCNHVAGSLVRRFGRAAQRTRSAVDRTGRPTYHRDSSGRHPIAGKSSVDGGLKIVPGPSAPRDGSLRRNIASGHHTVASRRVCCRCKPSDASRRSWFALQRF
jgi:hypothetical protein